MEQTDTEWPTVLEKNGLSLEADIFENYGIDSETDLSVLDQDDFSKLVSRGMKPFHVKKLESWCDAVRERVENMLPSSLNTPAATALLSSNSSHNFFLKKRQSGSFLSSPFCHLSITNTSFLSFMSTPTSYILPPVVFSLSVIINKVRIREHLFAPSRTRISRPLPIAREQRPNIPHTKRNPTWASPFARAMGQDYSPQSGGQPYHLDLFPCRRHNPESPFFFFLV